MSALVARAARGETIVVASSDPGFVTALTAALDSSGLAVTPAQPTWRGEVTDLTGDARALADESHASATIALVFGSAEATLIAYDRALDRVLLRVLPFHAPLTEAQSAELASAARSMLRALRVTPDLDLPPPHASEAAAIREHAAAIALPKPASAPHDDLLALELGAGARFGAVGATASEEAALGIVVRPDGAGGVVSAIVVPSTSVTGAAFMGTVAETSLAASARLPLHLAARLSIAASAGIALHRIHLAGTTTSGAIDVTRYDPGLCAGFDLRYALRSGLEVGASASLEGLLRYQDYTVAGVQVLDVPAARVSLRLSVLARIM
jgi:hypothetical protein